MGRTLAERGIGLVYGGGGVGLMGAVADAALAAGGEAVGVIPRALQLRELAHPRLTELHVVGSMHERKAKMAELAHGFVALPGGMGTLEEFAEILTWAQLGLHARPDAGSSTSRGYYQPLIAFFDRAVAEGFVRPEHRRLMVVARGSRGAPRPVRRLAAAARREVARQPLHLSPSRPRSAGSPSAGERSGGPGPWRSGDTGRLRPRKRGVRRARGRARSLRYPFENRAETFRSSPDRGARHGPRYLGRQDTHGGSPCSPSSLP